MCGLAGYIELGRNHTADEAAVRLMTSALRHRGPDDEGYWVDAGESIALGHRRLSIVDLSPHGHQPMISECGQFVITFNGEIYNYLEIRKELEKVAGNVAWRGHSDTEVMLAAIRQWGPNAAIKKFVGMFAFALWDRHKKVLHLARDRLGEKPLYYGWMSDFLLFGSELKALRAHPTWRGEINRDVLALFLRHNYIPAPYSIYENVHKLLPGTMASISAAQLREMGKMLRPGPLKAWTYWSAQEVAERGVAEPFTGPDSEAVTQLEAVLKHSVKQQMVADVPLGAFLSGGIDSSTVVALMQAQSQRPVKTFSIGFNEDQYNEAEYAKAVACHLGTDHTEFCVTPQQAMAVIPKLPTLYDEPFSDSSQIPTFLVSELARQHVTVSLSGTGR
jgi:asparagine synthase (glutamine-hydrolyzing)